jgi:hypothetical protein
MLKIFLFFWLVLSVTAQEQNQNFAEIYGIQEKIKPAIPAIYQEMDGLKGKELFLALHKFTGRNYKEKDYREAKSYMYDHIDNRNGKVFTVYSGLFIKKTGYRYLENNDENGDGISEDFVNCEHVWPQSKFDKELPMVSDVHHLLPSLSKPNGVRSNYAFGIVDEDEVEYETSYGSEFGCGLFEPADSVKGNIARAMMYFYTRYHNREIFHKTYSADEFWFDRIPQFLKWHEIDPPDDWEKSRNDAIERYQGNRNPFIDYPEFVNLIGVEGFLP